MRLIDNTRYLTLVREALESVIVPDLKSPAAQAAAGIVQGIVAELLKRERRMPQVLDATIAEGSALVEAFGALLKSLGPEPARVPAEASVTAASPDARLARHAELNAQIAQLGAAVVAMRAPTLPASDSDEVSRLLRQAAEWELGFYRRQREPLDDSSNDASAPADKDGRIDRETLQAFIRSRHPDGAGASVVACDVIPGGYGKQTARFTLREGSGAERELIVRKSDRNPMVLHGTFLIEHEYALVAAVSATGYPAPKPLWVGTDVPGVDAGFYVMEKMPGRIPGSFLGGPESGVSEALLLDVAAQMARLHAIPLGRFAGYIHAHDDPALLSGTVQDGYRRAIQAWGRYADKVDHLPSPYTHFMRDWLLRHVPDDSRSPVLVHGDFNVHNLLVEGERVSGVLDWECAMFGAPEQDLAYIQPHISRHIAWDKFLARYREAGGREIDSAALPFYQAFSMMRLHLGMNHGLLNLQSGANRDIRYSMIELAFGPQIMEMGLACAQAQ